MKGVSFVHDPVIEMVAENFTNLIPQFSAAGRAHFHVLPHKSERSELEHLCHGQFEDLGDRIGASRGNRY